jgi:hypothetical protein
MSTPIITIPSGLEDKGLSPQAGPSSSGIVRILTKDILDQFIDIKIFEYTEATDDNDTLWARFTDDFIG